MQAIARDRIYKHLDEDRKYQRIHIRFDQNEQRSDNVALHKHKHHLASFKNIPRIISNVNIRDNNDEDDEEKENRPQKKNRFKIDLFYEQMFFFAHKFQQKQ